MIRTRTGLSTWPQSSLRGKVIISAAFCIVLFANTLIHAQTYTVLHRFTCADGAHPSGRLVLDAGGNIYGTTQGDSSCYLDSSLGTGLGTVWKIDAQGVSTVLHAFGLPPDGSLPAGGLIRDAAGNLYGVTPFGGLDDDNLCLGSTCGTLFELDASGNMTQSYQFSGTGGVNPSGTLIRDSAGNLYGTTVNGGDYTNNYAGYGTVFKLDVNGNETVLHAFNGADGQNPNGSLTADSAHNLYGTTVLGGAKGVGTIFKVDLNGNLTTLHSFSRGRAGESPAGGIILDTDGNMYGVSPGAGRFSHGAIFKLDPSGHETLLHSFTGGVDGAAPTNTLIRDAAGNLYGTAAGGANGAGVVFKLDPSGTFTVLHSFAGLDDGAGPDSPLLMDARGSLYGVTNAGGDTTCGTYISGCGVLYKISR